EAVGGRARETLRAGRRPLEVGGEPVPLGTDRGLALAELVGLGGERLEPRAERLGPRRTLLAHGPQLGLLLRQPRGHVPGLRARVLPRPPPRAPALVGPLERPPAARLRRARSLRLGGEPVALGARARVRLAELIGLGGEGLETAVQRLELRGGLLAGAVQRRVVLGETGGRVPRLGARLLE